MKPTAEQIVGCVLAGGQSRRMGGQEKALLSLGGQPMLARVVERLRPQVGHLILNANGDPNRFASFGLPVVADNITGFAGPLAGVEAGMRWALQNAKGATHMVTAATDTPFFPENLLAAFADAITGPDVIVMATSKGNRHPVFTLWPLHLHGDLFGWLQQTDTFKVMAWVQRHNLSLLDFPPFERAGQTVDPFFNANTPEEFAVAENLIKASEDENARRLQH
ncbi:MAG: molybdenum cofactor guanylyltransferase MobA [Pseudomonadota bacterium]